MVDNGYRIFTFASVLYLYILPSEHEQLAQRWFTVGPVNQRWANVSCLLGNLITCLILLLDFLIFYPANMRRWPNISSPLGQRRRWANSKLTLGQRKFLNIFILPIMMSNKTAL